MEAVVFIWYFVGCYFLQVLLAFAVVQRFGRRFHESDALVILAPYIAYWLLCVLDSHRNFNFPWAPFATGCVVAVCMPFRLLSWLGPWQWALPATFVGTLAAYITYLEFPTQSLVMPI